MSSLGACARCSQIGQAIVAWALARAGSITHSSRHSRHVTQIPPVAAARGAAAGATTARRLLVVVLAGAATGTFALAGFARAALSPVARAALPEGATAGR